MNDKRPKPGTLYDESGNTISRPPDSVDDLNLPPGVAALIETRINTGLDRTRELNRYDLGLLADEVSKKWRYLTVATSLVAILSISWNVFSWFFAPESAKHYVQEFIEKRVAEPAMQNTLATVARAKATEYVDMQLEPLIDATEAIRTEIATLTRDLASKQEVLAGEQKSLNDKLLIVSLSVEAKNGNSNSFRLLVQTAESAGSNSGIANTYLKDVNQFFTADRHSLTQKILTFKGELKERVNPSVDEVIPAVSDSSINIRAAAANALHELERKSSVAAICTQLAREEDLLVISRLTRALSKVTGKDFDPLDVGSVAAWWEENKNESAYHFPVDDYLEALQIFKRRPGNEFYLVGDPIASAARIQMLNSIVTREPHSLITRVNLVFAYVSMGEFELAAAELSKIESIRSDFRGIPICRAMIAFSQNERDKAIEALNVAVKTPSGRKWARQFAIFEPLASDVDVKWASISSD